MNLSGIIGVLAAAAVLFLSIFTATTSAIFLNTHAILIVFGGTLAATLLCIPINKVFLMVKVVVQKVLGKRSQRHALAIEEIVELAKGYRDNPSYLQSNVESIKNPFLKEAIGLTIEGGIPAHEIDNILEKRSMTLYKRYEDEASHFKVISKFPPAFGLMGTTMGMIGLLQSIGSPDSFKTLGPAMAVALVATFYGIVGANLIFIPIGENLSKLNQEEEILRNIIIDGVQLLRQKQHPLIVEEHLKSYLLPGERERLKKAS